MAITYTWEIKRMNCLQTPEPDSVVIAQWTYTATEGAYTAVAQDSSNFTVTEGSFTPYADLTEDQVIGWVTEGLGEANLTNMQINLADQISQQQNPPVVPEPEPLPW